MTTAVEDGMRTALNEALIEDAGAQPAAPPAAPPPPRLPDPAEAPAQKPKRTRTVKPKGDDAPRVAEAVPEAAVKGDYTAALTDFGNEVWMGASMLRGGRVLGIPIPDARPFAAVWKETLPDGVMAWNRAAQQNATVRRYVSKLGDEGGVSWVIGVGLWAAGLVGAATALAKAPAEIREQVIAKNDEQLAGFIAEQVRAMGFEVPEEQAA